MQSSRKFLLLRSLELAPPVPDSSFTPLSPQYTKHKESRVDQRDDYMSLGQDLFSVNLTRRSLSSVPLID